MNNDMKNKQSKSKTGESIKKVKKQQSKEKIQRLLSREVNMGDEIIIQITYKN